MPFDKLSATAPASMQPRTNGGVSFDRLSATAPCVALPPASMQSRTNGKTLIPFVVSWPNHEWNQFVQSLVGQVVPVRYLTCYAKNVK